MLRLSKRSDYALIAMRHLATGVRSASARELAERFDIPVEAATEITAGELRSRIAAREPLLILDVREPSEHAAGAIDGSRLVPLAQLAARLDELPKDRPIAAYCAAGVRSAKAAKMLREKGFQAVSLKGGIAAWRR